jgi:hypothetical protein
VVFAFSEVCTPAAAAVVDAAAEPSVLAEVGVSAAVAGDAVAGVAVAGVVAGFAAVAAGADLDAGDTPDGGAEVLETLGSEPSVGVSGRIEAIAKPIVRPRSESASDGRKPIERSIHRPLRATCMRSFACLP